MASPVHWKKVAEALFSDSSFVAAGKRRDFCRLSGASFTANAHVLEIAVGFVRRFAVVNRMSPKAGGQCAILA
jgi:hypothetical protein